MATKTELRKTVGRGKFTSAQLAEAAEVSRPVARRRLARLVEEGTVELLPEVQKVDNVAGDQRGRPRKVYRVAKGK